MIDRQALRASFSLLAGLAVASCSGGGGGGNPGTTSFQVSNLSVPDGSVWQINREIVLAFTEPVDFTTVSANTINIRSTGDVPATGVFSLRDPLTVVFQPNCPTLEDFSDAGFLPGGVTYVLRVAGLNSSPNTVRSLTGVPLGIQQTRTFSTPASLQPSVAFQDTRLGPPAPILRSAGSSTENATYLEIGGDPDDRVYFELDSNQQPILSIPDFEVPLNLYSDLTSRVAVLIAFDQPVNPSSANISEDRLRLEYLDGLGNWKAIDTRVSLDANCTETGSTVRLEPVGVLPPGTSFRAVIGASFQDLVGEAVQNSQDTFAVAPTRSVDFSSLTPADALSDEFHETFDFGGEGPKSFEDTTALFDTPVGEWGGGQLSAAFSFEGTGGPNGDFDWIVRTGEIFFFDTTNTPINGGPNGVPTTTLNAINGIVDVRSFIIEPGGEVRVQGPNPMRINATGDVIIRGKLDISGFSAKDVATLNTGNQVEIGGAGTAGGGKGGNANDNITGSTPRGGRGSGPFRQLNLGGEGGEMGFNPTANKNSRRPGGGGGGRFAQDAVGTETFTTGFGMNASAGRAGNGNSTGAVSGLSPAPGGLPGQGPFIDSSSTNDHFGIRPVVSGGVVTALIRGELPRLWAGYGGGGGGNAGRAYPNPNWNLNSDEKGGGGGGGGGALHIKALGRIAIGEAGQIVSNGGRGATGENTNFLDHIAGTGGGGSGGHVILESATVVDFTDSGAAIGVGARDFVIAAGPVIRPGPTADVDTCCRQQSNGGAGGPGIIQIHVPDAKSPPSDSSTTSDILVPTLALSAANVIDQVTSPPAFTMIPTFGARSTVRSKWISIGGADEKENGSEGLVQFLFGGIQTDDGEILTEGSSVIDLTPLVVDNDLLGSNSAELLPDGFTLELTGTALDVIRAGSPEGFSNLSNDIYLRTPALLADCVLRLFVVQNPAVFQDFTIASATYDEGAATPDDEALRMTVTTEGGSLDEFIESNAPSITGFQLLPRFFRVVTNGQLNSLPETASVFVRFQAARDNGNGAPDEVTPLVPWTSNIALFNAQAPGELQYFRFEVEFDLDAGASGVTEDTEPVKLDFLKIPFVF